MDVTLLDFEAVDLTGRKPVPKDLLTRPIIRVGNLAKSIFGRAVQYFFSAYPGDAQMLVIDMPEQIFPLSRNFKEMPTGTDSKMKRNWASA